MSNELGLGKLITTEQHRDAIHVAVAPVTAAHRLSPGDHVGLDGEGRASEQVKDYIGIVDPYIKGFIDAGERFWLFLYPYTVTALRHSWEHPAFDSISLLIRCWPTRFLGRTYSPAPKRPATGCWLALVRAFFRRPRNYRTPSGD